MIPAALRTALLISVCVIPLAARAQLDPSEQAIVRWTQDHAEDAIALIERQVNINSGTMNHAGVRQVAELLEPELAALGMQTEWLDMSALNRAGHLFGRLNTGREGGTKILMIGHLDTVFEPGDSFQDFAREGRWATGPGVSDMKSGNAVIVYALKALEAVGALEDMQVVVAYTGDEEQPGSPVAVSREALIEAGQWADVSLGFENGIATDDGVEWATTARRGFAGWQLTVTGQQSHSSQIFSEPIGAGAIFEAARILNDFYAEVRGEEYLTFNAGLILGGTDIEADVEATEGQAFGKRNVVPRQAIVLGEMRTISQDQLMRTREKMRAVVARHLPQTNAELSFDEGYPAMFPSEGNERLRVQLSKINEDLGRGSMPAVDPLARGAADIAFVSPYTDGLAGMGPAASGGHTPNERLDLESIPAAVQRAAILMYRLSR
ncbi:MAG TPA: M20/M25/M40 family metallo-hydrolase [Gammaproteobacteria bacterium]|nr:M20/M25/M40 family metallo-hydrolase [Gammaproteobacteria bacterium]